MAAKDPELLAEAHAAIERGDPDHAIEHFEAVCLQAPSGRAFEGLGLAHYLLTNYRGDAASSTLWATCPNTRGDPAWERKQDLVYRMYEELNGHDAQSLARFYSEDCEVVAPPGMLRGRDSVVTLAQIY